MSEENLTETTTDQSTGIPSVEDIVRRAVEGISKELPNIIDTHLKEREDDLLSTRASNDFEGEGTDNEDAGASPQNQRDASAQNGKQGDSGAPLEKYGLKCHSTNYGRKCQRV